MLHFLLVSLTRPQREFNLENDIVYTTGFNSHGQLGINDKIEYKNSPALVQALYGIGKIIWIACGANQTFAVIDNGDVYAWGKGAQGALGLSNFEDVFSPEKITLEQKIIKVDSGVSHTTFIDSNGSVYVCG